VQYALNIFACIFNGLSHVVRINEGGSQNKYVHLQNIEDLKTLSSTRIPVFDFEKNKRSGSKELVVSEDCGVVSLLSWLLRMV